MNTMNKRPLTHEILISKFISLLLNIDRNKYAFEMMYNNAFDGK